MIMHRKLPLNVHSEESFHLEIPFRPSEARRAGRVALDIVSVQNNRTISSNFLSRLLGIYIADIRNSMTMRNETKV